MTVPSAETERRNVRASLSRTERLSLSVTSFVNEWGPTRNLARRWNTGVMKRVVDVLTSGRLTALGVEHLEGLPPDRGVLFAPNHRSLFDLFVVAKAAYEHVPRCRKLLFPVRSNFWYDHPLGLLVNALATGCSMYPPVFRPAEKRAATRAGLDTLAMELRRPGTLAGMHPEGTRGKGTDPYELLPAEPSFGRVVLLGRPTVVPVFINGVGNSLAGEIGFGRSRGRSTINVVFGEPLRLPPSSEPERLRAQIEVGRATLAEIAKLADRERKLRRESLLDG